MSVLFTQNWDIIPGSESEYAHFITDRYIPGTTGKGFYPVGGYYVEVGFGPKVVAVYAAESLQSCRRLSQICKVQGVDPDTQVNGVQLCCRCLRTHRQC